MINRGQGISERFDGETGVSMPLRAGELSLHHTALVHCSPGNDNDDRRMGLGISFIPAHVRPLGPVKPSALLVRGEDRYGHFLKETRLGTPMSPEAQAAHAEAVRLFRLRQDQGFTKAAENSWCSPPCLSARDRLGAASGQRDAPHGTSSARAGGGARSGRA